MLGNKIKKIRNEKGMTQKDLADKLFVTPQAVSRWEKNEVEPSISTVIEIAKIFELSLEEFLEDTQPKQEEKDKATTEVKAETKEEQPKKEEAKEIATTAVEPKIEPKVEPKKVVLAVCEQCNKPIYKGIEIVRKTTLLQVIFISTPG